MQRVWVEGGSGIVAVRAEKEGKGKLCEEWKGKRQGRGSEG